ncbi:MAG TPA: putative ATP-grasp-modified RiPP [Pseudonocardiaceae bacterium]|jgi:putative ATP-grasp target RiPP|nr:putative ATP-grasp-modified RiPP [Pseudonocardiaceae bacterium]
MTTAPHSIEPEAGTRPSPEPVPEPTLDPLSDPLSSASLRYLVHQAAVADQPGPVATRPFGLRGATPVAAAVRPSFHYSHQRQVAVDSGGRPLIETMGKDWKTKASTDGDEGPEEHWGWEES